MANEKSTGTSKGLEALDNILRKKIDEWKGLELPEEEKPKGNLSNVKEIWTEDGKKRHIYYNPQTGRMEEVKYNPEILESFSLQEPKEEEVEPLPSVAGKKTIEEQARMLLNKFETNQPEGAAEIIDSSDIRQYKELQKYARAAGVDLRTIKGNDGGLLFEDYFVDSKDPTKAGKFGEILSPTKFQQEYQGDKGFYKSLADKLGDTLEGKIGADTKRAIRSKLNNLKGFEKSINNVLGESAYGIPTLVYEKAADGTSQLIINPDLITEIGPEQYAEKKKYIERLFAQYDQGKIKKDVEFLGQHNITVNPTFIKHLSERHIDEMLNNALR